MPQKAGCAGSNKVATVMVEMLGHPVKVNVKLVIYVT